MLSPVSAACLSLCIASSANALYSSTDVVYRELTTGGDQPAVPPRSNPVAGGAVSIPEVDNKSFWFANFTVGAAQTLELLIDTGSADVYLNPARYKPSAHSVNEHKNFSITFATTKPNGSGTVTLSGPLMEDIVSSHGLGVNNQELGTQGSPAKSVFPHDGLVGFGGQTSSAFGGRPWIHSLCAEKKVDECRFGLAFQTNKVGTQIIGGVDSTKFQGSLTVAPTRGQWALEGDIAVNNKIVSTNQLLITDSGTTVVFGPLEQVRKIFKEFGIQTVLSPGNPAFLRGFFPCDKPPTFGFGFPSASDVRKASGPVSKKSTIFNIDPKAMAFKNDGNNNCTAALQGMRSSDLGDIWLVGQAFFQAHYIDHNNHDQTMGFANLI